jgi:hypothetical protein
LKTYLKNLFLFALPLTVLTFCLVTARVEQICDGEHFITYGFPFVWSTPGATSLSTAVDLMLGVIDLFVYFTFFAALAATSLSGKFFGRKQLLIAILLWITALIVGEFFLIFLSFDPYPKKVVFFPCEKQNYRLHFGFPFKK